MWIPEADEMVQHNGIVFQVAKRTRIKETGEVFIFDQEGHRFSLNELSPFNPDRPLLQDEILTLQDMLRECVHHSDPTDLDLIRQLTPEQKVQVWEGIDSELRQKIHKLMAINLSK